MPDWTSHLLIAYITINVLRIRDGKAVYMGVLLPDIFKLFIPLSQMLGITGNVHLNFLAPFHTVFGVILSGLFISTFYTKWKRTYGLILLGTFLHFAADLLLYPWGLETWIFYPLWQGDLGTGFLWPDSFLLLGTLLVISGVFYIKNRSRQIY